MTKIETSLQRYSPDLVIHVGQHKTGSTAIQQKLSSIITNKNFHYPLTGRVYSGHHKLYDRLKKASFLLVSSVN